MINGTEGYYIQLSASTLVTNKLGFLKRGRHYHLKSFFHIRQPNRCAFISAPVAGYGPEQTSHGKDSDVAGN